jgi:site-specific DNA-methyltransferase (adenine-specific)
MDAWYQDARSTIYNGDCLEVLRALPDASVDAVVTDPPYGLEFMGKDWDKFKTGRAAKYSAGGELTTTEFKNLGTLPQYVSRPAKRCANCGKQAWSGSPCKCPEPEWQLDNSPLHAFQAWAELWAADCLRVLKPGGHLLAFGGTRTWHRLACAIEDAGFEVRDSIAWLYGSGFPKSLDVSKAIDKAAGAERQDVYADNARNMDNEVYGKGLDVALLERRPNTPEATTWSGWGTALKPAHEPIVVARKPLVGTVAANVLEHGTGALNIDACRIGTAHGLQRPERRGKGDAGGWAKYEQEPGTYGTPDGTGRWPANVVLDEDQADELDRQSGVSRSTQGVTPALGRSGGILGAAKPRPDAGQPMGYADHGGASRFFYVAKAPAKERPKVDGTAHPTVKPLTLMRWLCRLVTPPGGVILEPFAGSGTTIEAALLEGFRVVAIEREADYLPLIQARLDRVAAQEPEDEQLTLDASA